MIRCKKHECLFFYWWHTLVCGEHSVPWQWSGQEMSFLPVVPIITCHLKIHPLHHWLCLSEHKHTRLCESGILDLKQHGGRNVM